LLDSLLQERNASMVWIDGINSLRCWGRRNLQ